MKRAVALFLALLFCFALYACGEDDTIPTNQSEPVDSSIDSVPTTNPTGIPTETIVPTEPATLPTEPVAVPTEPTTEPTESAPHNHQFGEWSVNKQPSCTAKGTEIRKCDCGETEIRTIEPTEHTFGEWVITIEASCTETGLEVRSCICSAWEAREIPSAGGHNYRIEVIPPTCNREGFTRNVCDCGHSYISDKTYFIDHDYIETNRVEATTESDGVVTYACSYCGDSYTETIPAIPLAGLEFRDNGDGTCTVVGIGTNKDKDLKIPAYHQGKKVTAIGLGAFYKCYQLTSVTIPGTVKEIGQSAFYDCLYLTSVTLEEGLMSIGQDAFYGCENLTGIVIPEGVHTIAQSAFSMCRNLTEAKIPSTVTSIGYSAFAYCQKLESIVLPDGLTKISSRVFYLCLELTSVNIPQGVTSIESYAFAACRTLGNVEIPDSVRSIGYYAFTQCYGFTELNLPKGLTTIDSGAFYDCPGIIKCHIPQTVTSIGDKAFYGCKSMTSLELPWRMEYLGESAFYECSSLTSIHVPFGLKTLAKGIFYGCSSLTTVHIPEDVQCIEASAFAGCNNVEALYIQDLEAWLKIDFGGLYSGIHSNPMYGAAQSTLYCDGEKIVHLVIPESVTYIEEYALAGCETLKSITVHNNVKFDSFVFNDCVGVKDIYFDGTQKEWKNLYLICQGMGSYTIHCSDGDIQK